MSCFRTDCENIMCDTYIDGVGYVCYECKSEFKDYLNTKGKTNLTEGEIKRELEKFMDTSKDKYIQGNKMDIDEFFESYTKQY